VPRHKSRQYSQGGGKKDGKMHFAVRLYTQLRIQLMDIGTKLRAQKKTNWSRNGQVDKSNTDLMNRTNGTPRKRTGAHNEKKESSDLHEQHGKLLILKP
jgi:hypothetical protein